MAERDVLRIVRAGLIPHTERTLVRLEPLLEELARVRRRDYVASIGEFETGMNELAAPVFDARGSVVGAVEVRGAAFRIPPKRIPELARQVRETASAISRRLGGVDA